MAITFINQYKYNTSFPSWILFDLFLIWFENSLDLGDFLDTYHNLSYKSIMGKLWVSEFCEQADFVVKTDDDMFIDLYATYFFTRHVIEHIINKKMNKLNRSKYKT